MTSQQFEEMAAFFGGFVVGEKVGKDCCAGSAASALILLLVAAILL